MIHKGGEVNWHICEENLRLLDSTECKRFQRRFERKTKEDARDPSLTKVNAKFYSYALFISYLLFPEEWKDKLLAW